jgi:hypothetical protein
MLNLILFLLIYFCIDFLSTFEMKNNQFNLKKKYENKTKQNKTKQNKTKFL